MKSTSTNSICPMTIDRPHSPRMAHRLSASPGLKSNGAVAATKHSGRSPQVTDKLDLSKAGSRHTVKLLALTGLALAGAVTGHVTNVTPSAVIADLTGSERLANLRTVSEHGKLAQGTPEATYRAMGAGRTYNYTSLELEGRRRIHLNNHRQVAELASYYKGEFRWGLSPEEMEMAADISRLEGLDPVYYGVTLDPEGVDLARSLGGRPIAFSLKRERYSIASIEDLREMHEFFFGESFSPEERRLIWAVRLYAGYRSENLMQVLKRFEAGESEDFYTEIDEVAYQATISSREELLELGQRILNQRENQTFQPFPHEVEAVSRVPLQALSREFDVAEAQLEAARGMNGVDPAALEQRLEQVEQTRGKLTRLSREIAEWSGGDSVELRRSADELVTGLDRLAHSSENWDPIGSERVARLKAEIQSVVEVVVLTAKPQAPRAWQRPPRLEDRYQTVESGSLPPKLYGPEPLRWAAQAGF